MGGGAERRVGAGSGAAGSEVRRVAVVTTGVMVGSTTSLCLLRNLAGWGVWSPSLSGVLSASMINSCAFDTECCVPCTR